MTIYVKLGFTIVSTSCLNGFTFLALERDYVYTRNNETHEDGEEKKLEARQLMNNQGKF